MYVYMYNIYYIYIYIWSRHWPKTPLAASYQGFSWRHSLSGQDCPCARGSFADLVPGVDIWISLVGQGRFSLGLISFWTSIFTCLFALAQDTHFLFPGSAVADNRLRVLFTGSAVADNRTLEIWNFNLFGGFLTTC